MEPIFATFTKSNWDSCLTKRLPEKMIEQRFQQVIEYMLDQKADELNKEYSDSDARLLHVAQENYKRAQTDKNFGYELAYISARTEQPVQVKLDDIVSKFDDCLLPREDLLEGAGKYKELQLFYNYKEVGGVYVPTTITCRSI